MTAATQAKIGLFVGLNKGHVVTRRDQPPRPNNRKGALLLIHAQFCHQSFVFFLFFFSDDMTLITELLKVGKDKRALKGAKRKLGTHKRAKRKREEMSSVLRKIESFGGGVTEKKKKCNPAPFLL
ncbi:hypothetical protein Bca4012_024823 [Brassica carinata]